MLTKRNMLDALPIILAARRRIGGCEPPEGFIV
jgi:hypothetical protein